MKGSRRRSLEINLVVIGSEESGDHMCLAVGREAARDRRRTSREKSFVFQELMQERPMRVKWGSVGKMSACLSFYIIVGVKLRVGFKGAV